MVQKVHQAVSYRKSPRTEFFQEKTAFGRLASCGHQDVGVEQVPVDQVAPLGAGPGKVADASFTGPEDPVEVAVRAEGGSPAVHRLRRVVSQAVTEPGSPGRAAARWAPVPANRQVRILRHSEKGAEQGCQHRACHFGLIGPDIFEAGPVVAD